MRSWIERKTSWIVRGMRRASRSGMRLLSLSLVGVSLLAGSFALMHCGGGVITGPLGSDGGGLGVGEDGGPTGGDGSVPIGADGGRPLGVPMNHIPDAPTCRMSRPAGEVNMPDAGNPNCGPGQSCCNSDSDCTAGTNGRCDYLHNGPPLCTYDQCFGGSDCSTGTTCLCANPMATADTNKCLPSNCRTDADCPGSYCSPTYDTTCGSYNGYVGIYCHTANDECANDSDCTQMGAGYCAFDKSVAHWVCEYGICAG